MINGTALVVISLLYIGVLFAIAWQGDRQSGAYTNIVTRRALYGLSLAVYFTSWTFYGAVGRATREGFGFLPIYLGPLLMLIFGAPLLRRILMISKRSNTTSIADFIASRYGKSQGIAALVALIAVVGSIPYITLQLKAIAMGFLVLTQEPALIAGSALEDTRRALWGDTAWYVALLLGLFTILFGTRHLESTEHHRGLIQAVAFESLVKLVAFVAVGLFVGYGLFDGFVDLTRQIHASGQLTTLTWGPVDPAGFAVQTLIAAFAIVCLPRQFHVMVVENADPQDFNSARWMMVAFLVVAAVFVLPIAAAGLLSADSTPAQADILVLSLPLSHGQDWLAVLAFLGGGSAAAAMVIVCCVALATMVSNEIVMPALLRWRPALNRRKDLSHLLLGIRRLTILMVLLVAYGFHQLASAEYTLTAFGLLAFAAMAQVGPALLGGILWRQGNRQGALWGMSSGFLLWLYTLVLPALVDGGWLSRDLLAQGPFGIGWLNPTALMGVQADTFTHGAAWSLGTNLVLYVFVSLMTRQRVGERLQIATFFQDSTLRREPGDPLPAQAAPRIADLLALMERFMGNERARAALAQYADAPAERPNLQRPATLDMISDTERQLASVIGASTARVVMDSALTGRDMPIEDVVSIVDEASQAMTFSRDVLQSAIEHINLGVSVVDAQQRLIAWNQRYLDLFMYPKDFVRAGRPIADLIRYNLVTANIAPARVEGMVSDRLTYMREGSHHDHERQRPDGTILRVQGGPIPGGGYMTTYQDITAQRRTEQALKETNTYLEQRVRERTEALQALNAELLSAKSTAERANQSKTRFLAAASHDLLQPLNAARLFTSALVSKPLEGELHQLATHIDSALTAAEEIISTLLDISKLDAGALEPQPIDFPINELLRQLATEFDAIAQDHGLQFHRVASSAWVRSDPQLLRRMIQNLLSNAMRYTQQGRILLGCRRLKDGVRIDVWDTGPGIAEDKLGQIFEEFRRLAPPTERAARESKGLGLGLAIVDRLSRVLHHPVQVRSWPGQGSVFSVFVAYGTPHEKHPTDAQEPPLSTANRTERLRSPGSLNGLRVLSIDNDPSILEGMVALLTHWGCDVIAASHGGEALRALAGTAPDIVLADYQLDDDENGLDTLDWLRRQFPATTPFPAILITGLTTPEVKADALGRGYQVLYKPVKPAALRAMMNTLVR